MNRTSSNVLLVLFAAVSLSTSAPRVAGADASDGKMWDWEDEERYVTTEVGASSCSGLNKAMQTTSRIPCTIDHASFDAYYKKSYGPDVARADRDTNGPGYYCNSGWKYLAGQVAGGFPMEEDIEKEFRTQVKSLRCVLDEKAPRTTVKFNPKTGELSEVIRPKAVKSRWIVGELLTTHAFPVLEHHCKQNPSDCP